MPTRFTKDPDSSNSPVRNPRNIKRSVKEEDASHKSPSKMSRRHDSSESYGITSVYAPKLENIKVGTMIQGKRQDVMLQYGTIRDVYGAGRTSKYLVRFRTSKKKVHLNISDFWLVLPEDSWVDSGSDGEHDDVSTVASRAPISLSKESVFQRILKAVLAHGKITVNKLKNLQLDEDSISCYMPLILSERLILRTSSANTVGVYALEDLPGLDVPLEELFGLRGQKINQQEAMESPFICDVRKNLAENKDVVSFYRFCGSMAMIRHRCYNHANCYTKDFVLVFTKTEIKKGEELTICSVETPGMHVQCDRCKSSN